MKKILSLLLVAALALSMVACGNTNTPDTTPSTQPSTTPTTEPTTEPSTEPGTEPVVEGKEIYMLNLAMGENYASLTTVTVYNDDMGGCYIEISGAYRKVATLDVAVLADIAKALNESGLLALAGAEEYGETETTATMSVVYPDWSSDDAYYMGVAIPEAFTTAFNTFYAYMETLLADVPVYVPQAMVMEGIDETLQTEMLAVLNNANIPNLDQMMVGPVDVADEYFGFSTGLSSAEGITAAANCSAMMITTAYSLVCVKAADVNAVAADFQANLDWMKWVCVQPTNAAIATKGDMVICLMGADALYTGTAAALTANGWTMVAELANPGM